MTEHRRTKRSQPPTSTQNVVKTITSPITGLVRIVALVLVSSIGFVFALWLLYTSYFVIGALCPWCLLVTLTTTLVWFAITRYNIREENLYLPKNISHKLQGWIKKDYDKLLLWVFVSLVAIAIVGKYGADLFA